MSETETLAARALKAEGREKALLGAAFKCFATYGFRRTSMEDIAQAAAMSRAALYQHVRNKEDVFRSLVEYHFLSARARVAEVLQNDDPVAETLAAALRAIDGEEIEALIRSPHGEELLATKGTTSAEVAAEGEAAIIAMIGDWLDSAEARGAVTLQGIGGTVHQVAALLVTAKIGIKSRGLSFDDYVVERDRLARVFGQALAL